MSASPRPRPLRQVHRHLVVEHVLVELGARSPLSIEIAETLVRLAHTLQQHLRKRLSELLRRFFNADRACAFASLRSAFRPYGSAKNVLWIGAVIQGSIVVKSLASWNYQQVTCQRAARDRHPSRIQALLDSQATRSCDLGHARRHDVAAGNCRLSAAASAAFAAPRQRLD